MVLDDIWAWRADHGPGVGWTDNTADTGVVVNGDDVSAYGLFVEHYQKDRGDLERAGGRVIFFQNEMPYDPPTRPPGRPDDQGLPGLPRPRRRHGFHGYGMGSYSFFNQGCRS